MADISSPTNARVKYIVKLRDDKHLRRHDGLILVEGKYELEMAFKGGLHAQVVYHCPELSSGDKPATKGVDVITVTRPVFEKLSLREGPDGWMALFQASNPDLTSIKLSIKPLLVLAESVEKPGNLGAILRTADAVGVDGLIVCDPRVDLFSPNVIRASRGTLFTVPCAEADRESALAYLKKHGISILAATPSAEAVYSDVDLTEPICILVGTEDMGLSKFWMENADLKVKIPMIGSVNSLNVATSSAIILYEAKRQRDNRDTKDT